MSWIMPALPIAPAPYEAVNKAGVQFAGSDAEIAKSYGIESVVRNSKGNYTIAFSSELPSVDYNVIITCTGADYIVGTDSKAVGSCTIDAQTVGVLGVLEPADPPTVCVMIYQ